MGNGKEKEVTDCIRALSNIEGYLMKHDDTPEKMGEHFDLILGFLNKELATRIELRNFKL